MDILSSREDLRMQAAGKLEELYERRESIPVPFVEIFDDILDVFHLLFDLEEQHKDTSVVITNPVLPTPHTYPDWTYRPPQQQRWVAPGIPWTGPITWVDPGTVTNTNLFTLTLTNGTSTNIVLPDEPDDQEEVSV